jgi:hypothetical protein
MDMDSKTDTSVYDEYPSVVRPPLNTDSEYLDNQSYPGMDLDANTGTPPGMDNRTYPGMDNQTYPGINNRISPGMDDRTYPGMNNRNNPGMDNRTYPSINDRNKPGMDNRMYLDTDVRMQEDFSGMKKELMTTCTALEKLQKIIKEKNKSSIDLKKQFNHEKEILLNKNSMILDDLRLINDEKNILVKQFEVSLHERNTANYDLDNLRKERFVYIRVALYICIYVCICMGFYKCYM